MGVALAILIVCLLALAVGLHVAGMILRFVVFLFAIVLGITMVVRWAERATERRRGKPGGGNTFGAGAEEIGGARACPNPHCRRINEGRARFCAQCGISLRRPDHRGNG